MDRGDEFTTLNIVKAMDYTLKMVKMVNLMCVYNLNSWTQFPTCGVETYPYINQTVLGCQQMNCSGKLS